MFQSLSGPALLLSLSILSACGPMTRSPQEAKAPFALAPAETSAKPSSTQPTNAKDDEGKTALRLHSARLAPGSKGGRIVELLDNTGAVVQTLKPADFSQTVAVPDIEQNSLENIAHHVRGTDMAAASVDPVTGRVLLAVRGFIYAEVSTDLVFVSEGDDSGATRLTADQFAPVYFDGPGAAQDEPGPRPHLDVSATAFTREGHLLIKTADASGGACTLIYDAERRPQACRWSGGESRRCPRDIEMTAP